MTDLTRSEEFSEQLRDEDDDGLRLALAGTRRMESLILAEMMQRGILDADALRAMGPRV